MTTLVTFHIPSKALAVADAEAACAGQATAAAATAAAAAAKVTGNARGIGIESIDGRPCSKDQPEEA
jgi:hypothetical protein